MTAEVSASSPPLQPSVRLPLTKPIVVYVLLGAIGVAFLAESVLGGSTSTSTLRNLGAQINSMVAGGAYWRLLAAMFLHIGLMHLAFNGWALFSIGRDVEAFYGSARFAAVFLIAGFAGNIAYFLLGTDALSAGASGAIFGLIGAEAAFFVRNRPLFGQFGRQRLGNLVMMIGINLVFGFTVRGVNNLAHLGGLLFGFLLGLTLSPRYQVTWAQFAEETSPRVTLIDVTPRLGRWLGIGVAVTLLLIGTVIGAQRWAGSSELLRERAQAAVDAGDLVTAQEFMELAVAKDPADPGNHFGLGLVLAQRGDLGAAAAALETANRLTPEQGDVQFMLGTIYAELSRTAEARALLERFIAQESTGDRADYARGVLSKLPQ